MSYFPDTAQGIAADALPAASALSGSSVLVLRQGGTDVQTTLSALVAFIGGTPTVSLPGAPGTPTQGSVTTTTIALSWAVPTTGGVPSNYIVQQSSTGTGNWTTVATPAGTTVTATGLAPATAYDFRVAGVNSAGTGSYSAVLVNAITSATLTAPNMVTGLTASGATASTITLSWTESGGAPSSRTIAYRAAGIGNYAAVPGGAFGATGGIVTGLSASTAYDFQVTASNSAGTSGAATLANVSTTVAAPGAITTLAKGLVTGTTAALTWTNAVGATGWTVLQRTPSGSGSYVVSTLSVAAGPTGATVSGLATGSTYDFQVAASNAGGSGPATTLTGVLTSPGAVTGLGAASITTSTVVLAWTNANGATAWTVTQRTPPGSGSYVASTMSVAASSTGGTVSGLTTGSGYDFQVVAGNTTGSGPAVTLTGVTPGAVGQVSGVTLGTPTSTSMPMTWTAPSGGSSPTGYIVELSSNGGINFATPITVNSADTYYVATGLTASTSYVARVTGFNSAGNGPASAVSAAVSTLGSSDAFVTLTVPSTATVGTGIAASYATNQTAVFLGVAQSGVELGAPTERVYEALSTSGGSLPLSVSFPSAGTYTIRLYDSSNTKLLAESRPIVVSGSADSHSYAVTSAGTGYQVVVTPTLPSALARGSGMYLNLVITATATGTAVTSGVYYQWSVSATTQGGGTIGTAAYGPGSKFTIHLETYSTNTNSTRYLWLYLNGAWVVVDTAGIAIP